MKTIDLLLQFAKKQQELSERMENLSNPRVEEEDEEEDEEEEFSHQHIPPKQTIPAFVGPSNIISNGSGNMVNFKVGGFDNNIISNAGNNYSTNYYGYPG
jgi:hypothetical protein